MRLSPYLLGVLLLSSCGGSSGERSTGNDPDTAPQACAQTLEIRRLTSPTRLTDLSRGCDYRVTSNLDVESVLTIDAGVEIQFEGRSGVTVLAGGLSIQGSSLDPVVLRNVPGGPAWEGVRVIGADEAVELKHVVVMNSGAKSALQAINGALDIASAQIGLEQVQVDGSESHGIVLRPGVRLLRFSENQINATQEAPLMIEADQVSSLDAGSDYAGQTVPNQSPYVDVQPTASLELDPPATWPALNVPYRLGALVLVAGQLKLGAGSRLLFKPRGFIMIDGASSMAIEGTAEQPVRMSSQSGERGEWAGLLFNDVGAAQSRIDHLLIADAGRSSGSFAQAAINLGGRSLLQLQNTTVSNGGLWAVGCAPGAMLSIGPGLAFEDNPLGEIQPACQR